MCICSIFIYLFMDKHFYSFFFLGGYLTKIKRKNIVCEMFCNSKSFFLFIERLIHILNLEFQMVCAYFHSNLSFKFCVGLFCIKSRWEIFISNLKPSQHWPAYFPLFYCLVPSILMTLRGQIKIKKIHWNWRNEKFSNRANQILNYKQKKITNKNI